jgi:hypothetical protein
MCVWGGLFVMAGPAVWLRCPWAAASPLFTFALIRYMSGGLLTLSTACHTAAAFPSQACSWYCCLSNKTCCCGCTLPVLPRHPRIIAAPVVPPRSCLPACVPPLERSYAERYGGQPQYEAYKASTNLLFPWPPRDKFP